MVFMCCLNIVIIFQYTYFVAEMGKDIANKDGLQGMVQADEHHGVMHFFNALGEVFFTVDMVNHRLMQISSACEKLYGYSQADFLADPMFWSVLIHPDDKQIIEAEGEALERGEMVCNE